MIGISSFFAGLLGGALYFWYLKFSILKTFKANNPALLKQEFRLFTFAGLTIILGSFMDVNFIQFITGLITSNILTLLIALRPGSNHG